MSAWDPDQHLRFTDHRLRPALDLIARVPLAACESIWDLGCGTGLVTRLLKARWPAARVHGVDQAPDALAAAASVPGIEWHRGDLASWSAPSPANLVVLNAVLHLVPDHARLLPNMMRQLVHGGVLALQMPQDAASRAHALLRETTASGPWAERLGPALRDPPVGTPEDYYDLLVPHATRIEIWQTDYVHVLQGENAVLAWLMENAVHPLLERLAPAARPEFLAAYAKRLANAYPRRRDGMTLYPVRRLFIVAQR